MYPVIPIITHFPHNPHCVAGKAKPCNNPSVPTAQQARQSLATKPSKNTETDNSVGLWFNAIPEAHLVFALGVMRCPYCQMAR